MDATGVEIAEVAPGEPRFRQALEVMGELRTTRSVDELEHLYAEARRGGGYRVLALFDSGECRAAAGCRVLTSFVDGRYLYVDDLVTTEAWRSRGYGERLEAHLREVAHDEGCEEICLASNVRRARAHRFYFRRGYAIESFNFVIRLDGSSPDSSETAS